MGGKERAKAKSVVQGQGRRLLDLPGVVGVGVGTKGSSHCVAILTEDLDAPPLREGLADRLAGVPTVVMEVGVLKPLSAPAEARRRNLSPRRRI